MVFTREVPPLVPPADLPLPPLARLGDLLAAWQAEAEAAHLARVVGIPRGPVTGLAALDQELGGALPAGVTVVHGSPGAGKSALALQIAATCGAPALYVTCEMSPLELFRRHTARVTATFLGKFKSGELQPADSLALARRAAAAAPLLTFADATRTAAPARWLADVTPAVRGAAEHVLVVIDSVHAWADALLPEAPEYERLNAALAALRKLASGLTCSVLVVAERNRASMTSGGLSAGAGTRKIEYGAELVIDLGRDEKAVADANSEVPVTLTLAKNRNGSPGRKVELRFHGALQRFREEGMGMDAGWRSSGHR